MAGLLWSADAHTTPLGVFWHAGAHHMQSARCCRYAPRTGPFRHAVARARASRVRGRAGAAMLRPAPPPCLHSGTAGGRQSLRPLFHSAASIAGAAGAAPLARPRRPQCPRSLPHSPRPQLLSWRPAPSLAAIPFSAVLPSPELLYFLFFANAKCLSPLNFLFCKQYHTNTILVSANFGCLKGSSTTKSCQLASNAREESGRTATADRSTARTARRALGDAAVPCAG